MDVYVLWRADTGAHKVGMSSWTSSRIKQIHRRICRQEGRPVELNLVHLWRTEREQEAYALEKAIQSALSDSCIGGEWFSCSLDAILAAAELVDPALMENFYSLDLTDPARRLAGY